MVLGPSLPTFVVLHVTLSVVGLVAGLAALIGMLGSRVLPGITALFLLSTLLTSVTGFFFPLRHVGLGFCLGLLSLVVLAPTAMALYVHRLEGHWRWIHVVGCTAALWFNGVIGVFQAYGKIGILRPLAGTPAVMATEVVVFIVLAAMGSLAVWLFRPEPAVGRFTAAASAPS